MQLCKIFDKSSCRNFATPGTSSRHRQFPALTTHNIFPLAVHSTRTIIRQSWLVPHREQNCFIVPQTHLHSRVHARPTGGNGLLSVLFHNGVAKVEGGGGTIRRNLLPDLPPPTAHHSRKALRLVSCCALPLRHSKGKLAVTSYDSYCRLTGVICRDNLTRQ